MLTAHRERKRYCPSCIVVISHINIQGSLLETKGRTNGFSNIVLGGGGVKGGVRMREISVSIIFSSSYFSPML